MFLHAEKNEKKKQILVMICLIIDYNIIVNIKFYFKATIDGQSFIYIVKYEIDLI